MTGTKIATDLAYLHNQRLAGNQGHCMIRAISLTFTIRHWVTMFCLTSAFSLQAYATDTLPELIYQRLSLMKAVASYKLHENLEVEDLDREKEVLADIRQKALIYGIEIDTCERFFQIQMNAAKDIQQYWIEHWRAGTPPLPSSQDLADHIRPKLTELGDAILRQSRDNRLYSREDYRRALAIEGLDNDRRESLIDAIYQLAFYQSRLDQILDSGVLRIGTTGDYPPFTHLHDKTGIYSGTDIERAHSLADSLGVQARFVPTTWQTLMTDLAEGQFDIAMGGVSLTLERLQQGYFSLPYYWGGKIPIARCDNKNRFTSLEDIDNTGVKIIVNPGGTNQHYVNRQIHKATIVVHPDNVTIFDELVTGHADVMITDKIEAQWQEQQRPQLCITMEKTLTYQEKAYLLPRDEPLKHYVDAWLSLELGKGNTASGHPANDN
jgi:cyclohexadienyl dehydratase